MHLDISIKAPGTLRVDNNLLGATSGFQVVDYLPAVLEFLGCGAQDNSAALTEEYPGSGRIDDTPAPAMAHPCAVPSTVETVDTDPPGPQPAGVYTKVTWDSASLAAELGSSGLGASGSFTIDYVMGVPQNANELFAGSPATTGVQGSNLDNNTGASTLETGSEQSATNRAVASGTYAGTGYESADAQTVTSEDLAIQKSVSTGSLVQGGVSTWTLNLQVSEYTSTASGIVVTDTVPDGLCPLGTGDADPECAGGVAPSPAYTSATENADGTWTLTWNLPDQTSNATPTVTFQTRARTNYQENGSDAAPVRANDSWTNSVVVNGTVSELGAAGRAVSDVSSAGQSATSIALTKEVAAPSAGACGDGSGLTWQAGTSSTLFGPGDIVCWRLTVNAPAGLDTTALKVTDFLPNGYDYVSDTTGPASDVAFPAATVSGQTASWTLPSNGDLDQSGVAQVVLASRITTPAAAAPADIVDNLAKLSYKNTAGTVFQLRDAASAPWAEPRLVLDKSATPTTATAGDPIAYSAAVSNTGNVEALDVQVRDILPARVGCADVTALPAPFTCVSGVINGTVPSIAAGATFTLTYTVTLPSDSSPSETFVNHAGVRQYEAATNAPGRFVYVPSANIDPAQEAGANTTPADDRQTVAVPGVALTKGRTTSLTADGNTAAQATVGEQVSYSVGLTIPNNTTMLGATITDTLPATLLLDTASPALLVDGSPAAGFTVTGSGNDVSVTFPTPYVVPAGADQVLTLTYAATVRDVAGVTAAATLRNTARLRYTGGDGSAVTRTATSATTVVEPNLTLAKTEDDVDNRATPGELISYHVSIGNAAGAATAYDTTVVDTLPTSTDPVDGAGVLVPDGGTVGPQNGVWNEIARTISWTVPTLAPNTTTVLDYQVRVANPIPSPTSFTNSVTASTTSLPGPVAGERTAASATNAARYTETAAVTLVGPRLSLTKTADVVSAAVGDAVTFTVVATVPPDVQTFDATILDTLPAGLTYLDTLSATCTAPLGCSDTVATIPPAGQRLAWFLGDLAPNSQTREFTIRYRAVVADVVAATAGASLANSAIVASNSTDTVSGTPGTPPAAGTFEGTTTPASDTVTVLEPTLVLDKDVAGEGPVDDTRRVIPGTALDYSVSLRNTGTGTAYGVVVSDAVDARMIAVTVADGAGWTVTDADPSDGTLGFRVASIAPGATVTITYQLRVPPLIFTDEVVGPELVNTADATYASAPAGSPGAPRAYDDVAPDTVSIEADLASLGDRVWFDTNGDGVQDPGEPGLAGILVTATYLGPDGVPGGGDDEVFTDITGSSGLWQVGEVPGGAYRVSVDLADFPAGTAFSHDLDGGGDGTADLTLGGNENRRDADFGVTGAGAVGDLVWLDRDADGVRDPGEPGLAGVGVEVHWAGPDGVAGNADDVVYTTTTGADGSWHVVGVPAGPVVVRLDASTFPSGISTASDPDGQLGAAADGAASGTLTAAQVDDTYDFGLRGDARIGDTLWVDTNRDGVIDAGEPGIPGAQVRVTWRGPDGVLGTADDLVVTTTTDSSGRYLVTGLPAGEYDVAVVSLPTSLAPTYDENDGTTSPDGATSFALAAGASHLTADFGYVAATGVGDRVWLDLDGDGTQDPGEPGLPGVMIAVTSAGQDGTLDTADDIVTSTTTGADGSWLVTGLPAGPTRVVVTGGLPPGVTATFDSDGTGTAGSSVITLVDGVTDLGQDFGYQGRNAIGDLVWADTNRDGTVDAGEPGLGGVGVRVTYLGADGVLGGGDDVVATAVTAADGGYHVTGLPDGDYAVAVVSGLPAGYSPTYDETGPSDQASTVVGLGGSGPQDHRTADFGYGGDGALGGTVWFDRDRSGVQNGTAEPGLGGIGIIVTWGGPDGVLGTPDDVVFNATTGSDGSWLIEDLPPGPYRETIDAATVPAGVTVVFDRDDGLVAPDGTWTGSLGANERRTDVDTGVLGTGSIGDLVWVDTDRDGVRDPGERAAPGVTVVVTWLGPDGVVGGGDDAPFVVVTNAAGGYVVDGLPAGSYTVAISEDGLPAGTSPGSDLDQGSATLTLVTLGLGQQRTDVDFALFVPVSAPLIKPDGSH